ncbi:MAG: AtpZ/AtpI family protein [Patescibacteria group bacterium]
MVDVPQSSNTGGPWWKPAMQIFSEVSTWIAVPIILALIAGKALDQRYDTKPLMLLVLAGIAFLISAYGIVQSVRNYVKKIKEKDL